MSDKLSIKLASTDDLINEIISRYDHAAFVGMKLLSKENFSGPVFVSRRFIGNYHTIIGLAHDLQDYLLSEFIEGSKEGDDEGPE